MKKKGKSVEIKMREGTMKKMIYDYLKINGVSKVADICKYVIKRRPKSTPNSINVTLFENSEFKKEGYGMWNLSQGCLKQSEKHIIRKMSILIDHYEKLLQEHSINGDTRLAGVDFDEYEKKIIRKCRKAHILKIHNYKKNK